MTYNKQCKKLKRQASTLYWNWRHIGRKRVFENASSEVKKGDRSLDVAHKRLTKLVAAIDSIRDRRAHFIR